MGLARRWRPRRPPDCAGVALWSGAKTVLQILSSLASGTSVPFLQAATQSTLHIIQLAEDVKQNRDDCIALAQLAGEIMQAVLSTTSGVEEHLFDPQIKGDILELQTTLDSIYDTMLRLSKLSKFKRILMRDKHAAKLGDYKSRLQNAVLIFNIKNGLSQRILIMREHRELAMKLQRIDEKIDATTVISRKILETNVVTHEWSVILGTNVVALLCVLF